MRSFRSAFVVLFAAGALSIARQEPEPIRFVAGANEY
jgi:hypothetical protein